MAPGKKSRKRLAAHKLAESAPMVADVNPDDENPDDEAREADTSANYPGGTSDPRETSDGAGEIDPAGRSWENAQSSTRQKRDDEFWFDDGTIILVAQAVEFRVYKGVLVDRIPIFQEMLSLPQPAVSDGDEVALCPTIHLADSARDWRNVFRVLMPRQDAKSVIAICGFVNCVYPDCCIYRLFKGSNISFETISACVRLGHKYEMKQLYQQAIDYLKDHFTHDFDLWTSIPTWLPCGFEKCSPIGVVNLARLTGEASMLPTALWLCCRLGPELAEGLVYSDGERETLSSADLGLCFVARSRLMQETVLNFIRLFPSIPDYGKCTNPYREDGCKSVSKQLVKAVDTVLTTLQRPDPLIQRSRALPPPYSKDATLGLCDACLDSVNDVERKRRRDAWKRLPALLGWDIPGWGH